VVGAGVLTGNPARLFITGGVFMRNMGRWLTFRKGALTTYYPEETRADYAAGNRGKHVLTQRPDGRPQCIACNLCATVCPAKVIEIEAGFDPDDPAHPKYPVRFEIDYSRCVFCGLCVEACPEDAIRMVKEIPICRRSIAARCGCRARNCSRGVRGATSPSLIRQKAVARLPEGSK
jgi:formate hydrogenlyase subunit 6/NADH:ubiquinone oxidoreductase subunit I